MILPVKFVQTEEDIIPIYDEVCGGSIDTLEKLRILEEHGSPVPPNVIVRDLQQYRHVRLLFLVQEFCSMVSIFFV